MGQHYSLPHLPSQLGYDYCSITFGHYDNVCILPASDHQVIEIMRSAFQKHVDIERKTFNDEADQIWYDIKVKRRNYDKTNSCCAITDDHHNNDESSTITRDLACQILANLYSIGWHLIASTELSRETSTTTWIFKQQKEVPLLDELKTPTPQQQMQKNVQLFKDKFQTPPPQEKLQSEVHLNAEELKSTTPPQKTTNVCCLSLYSFDTIQLVTTAMHLKSVVIEECQQIYDDSDGILSVTTSQGSNDLLVKLQGSQWKSTHGSQLTKCRFMILGIIEKFYKLGYQLYATLNVKGTADSIFFLANPSGVEKPEEEEKELETVSTELLVLNKQFMAISLEKSNRIRFLRYNQQILDVSRQVVIDIWRKGIVREEEKYGSWEFLLEGSPWKSDVGPDSIASRYAIMMMLQRLEQIGWRVLHSIHLSKRLDDKSTFILESCTPVNKTYICFAPTESNKLNMIGIRTHYNYDVIRYIKQLLEYSYPLGIKCTHWHDINNAFEFEFNGEPWSWDLGQQMHSHNMMTHLLKALNNAGWSMVTSCDTSAKVISGENDRHYNTMDVHSWIFSHEFENVQEVA